MSLVLTEAGIAKSFPWLASLMSVSALTGRAEEFARLGIGPMHQMERDLELLSRRMSTEQLSAAYRSLLRNPGHFIEALYEVHVASMLAPICSQLLASPPTGQRRCDVECIVASHRVFFEVTAFVDRWPPVDGEMYSRATVERSFDPSLKPDEPRYRDIPASKEMRDRISAKAAQLPLGMANVVVLGAPNTSSRDVAAVLFGDEYVLVSQSDFESRRSGNGLFTIPDDIGGASRISALVWLKLHPEFSGVQVQSRFVRNPLAAVPLPAQVSEALIDVFDRRTVLQHELERIKQVLLKEYHPERIILFGSLAAESRTERDWVHEWSDIDLAIVKTTNARFRDRIGEVLRIVRPRVGFNVVVYTPEEFERAAREGGFFVRDEILERGIQLYP